MERLILGILLATVISGCESPAVPRQSVTQAPRRPTSSISVNVVESLRKEAHNRNLRWSVWCTTDPSNDKESYYCARAALSTEPKSAIYAEDGKGPYWIKCRFANQTEAADWLLNAIQGEPNTEPQHRPRSPQNCSDEIGGS